MEAERAETQRKFYEVEELITAKHQEAMDDISKMKQNAKWDKETTLKRTNEVHEMATMQGKANQRTAAAMDNTISQVGTCDMA